MFLNLNCVVTSKDYAADKFEPHEISLNESTILELSRKFELFLLLPQYIQKTFVSDANKICLHVRICQQTFQQEDLLFVA